MTETEAPQTRKNLRYWRRACLDKAARQSEKIQSARTKHERHVKSSMYSKTLRAVEALMSQKSQDSKHRDHKRRREGERQRQRHR